MGVVMVNIGEINILQVKRIHSLGYFLGLTGGDEEVLLPQKMASQPFVLGDSVSVFVYKDTDGQLSASLHFPKAVVGEIAYLKVLEVNNIGAFLDWGMPKDLLCPYGEQKQTMEVGKRYLVMVFLDEQGRIAASARVGEFLDDEAAGLYTLGQEVSVIIGEKTPLGWKAIVNNSHWGVLYENELFNRVRVGEKLLAYIKKIREDDRIDLSLQKPGFTRQKVLSLSDTLLMQLQKEGGFLPFNDKTPPENIYDHFGVSKKSFKQAIGNLLKQQRITTEEGGIRLIK